MADIKLRRRRKPLWPWITGLIILLALGWGIFEALNQRKANQYTNHIVSNRQKDEHAFREFSFDSEDKDRESIRNSRYVNEFARFVADGDMYGTGNSYEAEGFSKLADALESVSFQVGIQDEELDTRLNAIRSKAVFIRNNGNTHGDSVNIALSDAVDAFEIIQVKRFPDQKKNIEILNRSIRFYSPSGTETAHKKNMQDFFSQAAHTIEVFSMEISKNQNN